MKAKEIMTKKIITVDNYASIYDTSNIMKKYGIGFIPISKENKIIGVITDRDIVCNIVANNCNVDDSIYEYINTHIISVHEDDDVTEVLRIMSKSKIKRVLVHSNNKLTGVISLSDIISNNIHEKELLQAIKEIWSIKKNNDNYPTEIDEFYL